MKISKLALFLLGILFGITAFANLAIGVLDIQPTDKKLVNQAGLNGMHVAVQNINQKGGLHSQRIELVSQTVDAKQAAAGLQKLIDNPKINIIVTLQDQGLGDVITAAASKSPKVFLSTAAQFTPQKNSYTLALNNRIQAVAAAQYVYNQMHRTSAVILLPDNQANMGQLADDFSQSYKKLGGRVRQTIKYPNFGLSEDMLNDMGQKRYDVIYLAATGNSATQVIKQLRALDITVPVIGNNQYNVVGLMQNDAKTLNDIYYTTNGYFDSSFNSAALNNFLQAYQRMFKVQPKDYAAALSYDAMGIVAEAIKQAKGDESVKVAAVLGKLNYSGLASDYNFNQYPATKMVAVVKIIKGKSKLAAVVIPQN